MCSQIQLTAAGRKTKGVLVASCFTAQNIAPKVSTAT
jgi:hypothetical protein